MSLHPSPIGAVPAETARVAALAFPRGTVATRLRDEFAVLYEDEDFAALYPRRGQPALPPWRLALVTVLQFQERERARLGRDLHDGVCQSLAGISLLLGIFADQLARGEGTAGEHAAEVRRLQELLGQALFETRAVSHGLTPVELDPAGVPFALALEGLARRTDACFGITCTVRCPTGLTLGGTVAVHLYRIAQEAVGNAQRHGAAARVAIGLSRRGARLHFTVRDDGVGIPEPVPVHDGLGLRTMAYRAAMVGGNLRVRRGGLGGGTVDGRPGTTVSCSFAWRPPGTPAPAS